MEYILLKGIVTGLILSIMLGPAFFLLIETSIRKGIKPAIFFDLGVFSSDILYILVAYIFFHEISHILDGSHVFIFKAIGGIIFIFFGALSIKGKLNKSNNDASGEDSNKLGMGFWENYIKGFLLNFANPMIILYWLSVITIGIQKNTYSLGIDPVIIYMCTILLTFFSIDLFKIFAAKKLQPFVTPTLLININRFVSIILIGFGAVLFIQGVLYFIQNA